MDGSGFLAIALALMGAGLIFRLLAGGMDHARIRRYVEDWGGEVVDSRRSPFGPGWLGEKSDRIYRVRYRDGDGNLRDAHCKTSLMTGVYFTQDEIEEYADVPECAGPSVMDLEEENRRLRERVERLKRNRHES